MSASWHSMVLKSFPWKLPEEKLKVRSTQARKKEEKLEQTHARPTHKAILFLLIIVCMGVCACALPSTCIGGILSGKESGKKSGKVFSWFPDDMGDRFHILTWATSIIWSSACTKDENTSRSLKPQQEEEIFKTKCVQHATFHKTQEGVFSCSEDASPFFDPYFWCNKNNC